MNIPAFQLVLLELCSDALATEIKKAKCMKHRVLYDASALPIIKKLGWPTINELIESETLKMVYKSVNDQAPIYLKEMFARLSDTCKRELCNTKTDMTAPRRKSAFGQKCFSYKGAKLWNDLSVEVKSSKSYEIFIKRINNANTEC